MPEQFQSQLQPHTILLKDGETIATMYPIPSYSDLLPLGLLNFLLDEFNMEIEKGDSFPYYETLNMEEFKDVWFHNDGHICVMVLGEIPELDYSVDNDLPNVENNYGTEIDTMRETSQYKKRKERRNLNLNIQWEKQCLGIFALQPAYPGRSSHVVTGTFLVNAGIRGKGIGRTLVETFVEWSTRLGFTSSCFPLVYGTNVGIRRILEGLNFRRIGKLPESAILKGFDVPVDSFIYGKEFAHITKSIDLLRDPQITNEIAKYERLKYYLETGKYPDHCDRNEKARLRVTGKYHSVLNGKLMTKGKEVVYDPDRQRQIALDYHVMEHQGINKVTSKIVEKYHWKGVKQTVSEIIQECQKCKMRYQDGTGVVVVPNDGVPQTRMLPSQTVVAAGSSSAAVGSHNNDSFNKELQTVLNAGNHIGDASSNLSRMAAAAIGSLQREQNNGVDEATPPDGQELRHGGKGSMLRQRIRFHNDGGVVADENYQSVSATTVEDNDGSMNAFNKFVNEGRENSTKKRRKNDGNASISIGTPLQNQLNLNTNGENEISSNAMNEAMLNLEGNVMAALEMVEQDQNGDTTMNNISSNDPFFNYYGFEEYKEEEDADYGGEEEEDEEEEEEEEEEDEDDDEDDEDEEEEIAGLAEENEADGSNGHAQEEKVSSNFGKPSPNLYY